MSRILEIAADIFWLVIIIGGGGWLFVRSLKASEDAPKIVFKWLITIPLVGGEILFARHLAGSIQPVDIGSNLVPTFMLVISIVACCVTLGAIWGSHIGNVVAKPLTSLFDGGNEPPEPKPYYSIAQTKRKLNKPLEAILEIRQQLAKFPNDYEGVILIASIQAEDMKDLPSAETTLNHFCSSPEAPPKQVAAALTQLADWHLKLAQDTDSARVALEKIIVRFTDTELSLAAEQRIAHLGGAAKILLASHDRQAMAVPKGEASIGLLGSSAHLVPAEENPEKQASDYVKHLQQHPNDTEIREKLAIIYARHYQRLDLATLELAQLINEPNHPAKRVAHWLNLLADLQIHNGADHDTVSVTLGKIIERFPDLPVADVARSRLGRLKLEIKGKKETPDKKLGVYEQNIGLKYGPTYGLPREL